MDLAPDGGGVFLEMNARLTICIAVLVTFCCHAAEVHVMVASSPQTVVVNNDGEQAQPTDMALALEELRVATSADPNFALAYSMFGLVYLIKHNI